MDENDSDNSNKQNELNKELAQMLADDFKKKHASDSSEGEERIKENYDDETIPHEFVPKKDASFERLNLIINDEEEEKTPPKETKKIEPEKEHLCELSVKMAEEQVTIDSESDELEFTSIKSHTPNLADSLGLVSSEAKQTTIGQLPDGNVLKEICNKKLRHIEQQKGIVTESRLRDIIHTITGARGFLSAINKQIASGKNALIAEMKKASPSRGIIRENFEPGDLARAYSAGGATCLSVLTDMPYFQGRDEYINMAKRSCDLPILRKDFILDPYQIYESRAIGADCILLIMAALTDQQAAELEDVAFRLGMDVLIEVHDEEEVERALKLKSMLIGINNRNLKSLQIDITTTERLASLIPSPKTIVCESGIYSHDDVIKVNNSNIKAFLVGESLMRQDDLTQAVKNLMGES